jgi:hypothetical protein
LTVEDLLSSEFRTVGNLSFTAQHSHDEADHPKTRIAPSGGFLFNKLPFGGIASQQQVCFPLWLLRL